MRQLAASAIIIEVQNLGERDRVVTYLTAEYGKKRGAARGARGKFSRFAGQLQPLARVHLTWFEKQDRDLVRIADAAVERSFSAGDDLERLLAATYLADMVGAFAQENEDSHVLFRLFDLAATRLAADLDPGLISRYVEIWALRLAGIFPSPDHCPQCDEPYRDGAGLIDHESSLVCIGCAGPAAERVGMVVLEALRRAGRQHLDDWATEPVAATVLADIERLTARVRCAFLGRELRSYIVLRQTLGSSPSPVREMRQERPWRP